MLWLFLRILKLHQGNEGNNWFCCFYLATSCSYALYKVWKIMKNKSCISRKWCAKSSWHLDADKCSYLWGFCLKINNNWIIITFPCRATSFAERLHLGLAVIHGVRLEAESDLCDGRTSPPPMQKKTFTYPLPGDLTGKLIKFPFSIPLVTSRTTWSYAMWLCHS